MVPKIEGEHDLNDILTCRPCTLLKKVTHFEQCNYWRKIKRHIVCVGSLITKENKTQLDLCLVTGIVEVIIKTDEQQKLIIRPKVVLSHECQAKVKNWHVTVAGELVMWSPDKIYSNAYYAQFCSKFCHAAEDQVCRN